MQGLFIKTDEEHEVRPRSKKQVKDLVAAGKLGLIYVEATSYLGNEYDGFLDDIPEVNTKIHFVGPNPHSDRRFYGVITVTNGVVKVT